MEHKKIISWMYLGGLALMIASIPLSKFTMSVAQFCLSGTIIIDFINRKRALEFFNSSLTRVIILFIPHGLFLIGESVYNIFRSFLRKENMPAIVFSSIILLHIIGLIYTTDFAYAFKGMLDKTDIITSTNLLCPVC